MVQHSVAHIEERVYQTLKERKFYRTRFCVPGAKEIPYDCLQEAVAKGYDGTRQGELHSIGTVLADSGDGYASMWYADPLQTPHAAARPARDQATLLSDGRAVDMEEVALSRKRKRGMPQRSSRSKSQATTTDANSVTGTPVMYSSTGRPLRTASTRSVKMAKKRRTDSDFVCPVLGCSVLSHRVSLLRTEIISHLVDHHGMALTRYHVGAGGNVKNIQRVQEREIRAEMRMRGLAIDRRFFVTEEEGRKGRHGEERDDEEGENIVVKHRPSSRVARNEGESFEFESEGSEEGDDAGGRESEFEDVQGEDEEDDEAELEDEEDDIEE